MIFTEILFFLLQSYFLLGDGGHTLDLSPLPDIKANITAIRFINPANADVYEYETQPYFVRNRYYKPMFNANLITVSSDSIIIDDLFYFNENNKLSMVPKV